MNEQKQKKLIYIVGAIVIIVFAILFAKGFQQVAEERAPLAENIEIDFIEGEKEQYESRLTEALQEIEEDPESFNSYTLLATSYEGLGNYIEAEKVYKKMNDKFPKNFLSFQNLGNLYRRLKEYEAAEKMYLRTIENAPRKDDLLRPLIELYTYNLTDKKTEIPVVLNKALENNANSAELLGQLAVYYRDSGEREKAIDAYERLLSVDDTNATARKELEELKTQ